MLAHGKQGRQVSEGKWCIVVEEEDSCSNFEYSRDVVAPEIARALVEGARLIPLTQDKFAIVDAEDYEQLCKYKWYAQRVGKNYYARNRRRHGLVSMHRVIMKAPKGLVVDHINHNTLDNRRKNLRLCTWAQNNQNRRPSKRKNKLSKYKGVSFDKKRKVYRVLIWHNKKQYFLGTFKDEKEAAKAYDKKAKELFGEFAYLNFHDLRKTFGSMLAQNGISTAVTQKLLEHSSPHLTNKVYTNVDPVLRHAVEQLPVSDWL